MGLMNERVAIMSNEIFFIEDINEGAKKKKIN